MSNINRFSEFNCKHQGEFTDYQFYRLSHEANTMRYVKEENKKMVWLTIVLAEGILGFTLFFGLCFGAGLLK